MISSIVDKIISYESGVMPDDEVLEFYQELVDTGMAFTLQGSYGRNAAFLISTGQIKPKEIK
jgi:hypothetical protein